MPRDWCTGIYELHEVEGNRQMLCMWVVGEPALVADKLPDSEVLHTVGQILRHGFPSILVSMGIGFLLYRS